MKDFKLSEEDREKYKEALDIGYSYDQVFDEIEQIVNEHDGWIRVEDGIDYQAVFNKACAFYTEWAHGDSITELMASFAMNYADQECAAKDAEIAELKRRVEELEQNAPKLVLPSVEEMRKYLNGYFGFGGDPSISDREYGFEHGYDYTIDEIKRLNGI